MSEKAAKILLVDDDEHILAWFQEVLEPEGCLVTQARDGVEALDKFDKYDPDLVLLDLMLPRMNGYEVCARFRRNSRTRHVPIIMLSGLDDRDAKFQALQSGVDDFLAKPVERAELIGRVRALLKLHFCLQDQEQQDAVITSARGDVAKLRGLLDQVQQQQVGSNGNEQLSALLADVAATCKHLDHVLT